MFPLPYVQKVDGKPVILTCSLTAFIGDSFNYAGDSDVSFSLAVMCSSVFEGEFTVSDAFNIHHRRIRYRPRAGSSLIVARFPVCS